MKLTTFHIDRFILFDICIAMFECCELVIYHFIILLFVEYTCHIMFIDPSIHDSYFLIFFYVIMEYILVSSSLEFFIIGLIIISLFFYVRLIFIRELLII